MKSQTRNAMICIFLSITATTLSSASAAEGGHGGGNGGNGGEIDFKDLRSKTFEWIERNHLNQNNMTKLHLQLKGLTGESLYEKLRTIQDVPVRFVSYDLSEDGKIPNSVTENDRVEIVVNGKSIPRTCINHSIQNRQEILCHEETYEKQTGSEKYKLGFHEELGLLAIESNQGIDSDYTISSNLINFWGPDLNGTLYDSVQAPKKETSCLDAYLNRREAVAAKATHILGTGAAAELFAGAFAFGPVGYVGAGLMLTGGAYMTVQMTNVDDLVELFGGSNKIMGDKTGFAKRGRANALMRLTKRVKRHLPKELAELPGLSLEIDKILVAGNVNKTFCSLPARRPTIDEAGKAPLIGNVDRSTMGYKKVKEYVIEQLIKNASTLTDTSKESNQETTE